MALTTSLFTGLSGLQSSSQLLDVSGNNIANVSTTAFKRSSADFETQIAQTLRGGSAPTGELGGTNPAQVGLGSRLAAITRDFSDGGTKTTGQNTDMSIAGDGFFVVDDNGATRYTRNGHFSLDRDYNLVTSDGAHVRGFGVDDDFNVVPGQLQDVNIPLGVLTLADSTKNVNFAGNLNAGGDVATRGTRLQTQALFAAGGGTPASTTTALSGLEDGSGNTLFNSGDVITLTGEAKGGATLPDATFEIGPANTTGSDANGTSVGDLTGFINQVLGIDETAGSGGVSVNPATGVVTIEGNTGTANALDLSNSNLIVNAGSPSTASPLDFTKAQAANGESVRTTFTSYDSLGEPLNVDLTAVLENKDNTGTQWRFYAQSPDDSDLDRAVATGTLQFNTDGKLVDTTGGSINIDLNGTGAQTPQNVDLNFRGKFGSLSALYDVKSQLNAISQDGKEKGTLQDFSVNSDGTIVGSFSNSLVRDLGRLPVATFSNNNGLKEVGGSQYVNTANSGTAQLNTAGVGGAGRVVGRSLEQSNVELSAEFINLIAASTGFSANSRVITTGQRLIQQLIATTQ